MKKQKFKRGSRVRIIDADERKPLRIIGSDETLRRPSHRDLFGGDEGIVVASYAQQYGGRDMTDQYTLTVLDSTGKPVNRVSWFDETQLELVSDDYAAGHDLIDAYTDRDA